MMKMIHEINNENTVSITSKYEFRKIKIKTIIMIYFELIHKGNKAWHWE